MTNTLCHCIFTSSFGFCFVIILFFLFCHRPTVRDPSRIDECQCTFCPGFRMLWNQLHLGYRSWKQERCGRYGFTFKTTVVIFRWPASIGQVQEPLSNSIYPKTWMFAPQLFLSCRLQEHLLARWAFLLPCGNSLTQPRWPSWDLSAWFLYKSYRNQTLRRAQKIWETWYFFFIS